MINTPNGNRKHISIFGKTNSGKSSLMNRIVGQEISLVSEKEGTTTDPVQKAMELLPYGPVLFIDTAGLADSTELGDIRVKRTLEIVKRTDFGIYVMDGNDIDEEGFKEWKLALKRYNVPYMLIINKIDTLDNRKLEELKERYKKALFLSALDHNTVETFKEQLIKRLGGIEDERPILGDIVRYNGKVILVVPIDSEAPKGRIILPQVQVIRDCLDHGIKSYVVRDTELENAIRDLNGEVDLVVTDSQAFKKVAKIVSENISLTSFSILFARHKGDLPVFIKGANKVRSLRPGDRILISESCTHNVSHEDIGRIKIPKLLNNYVGGELNYEFRVGHDFPDNIKEYDLIIHCGACMINRKTVVNRVRLCEEKSVAITNYGVILAFLNGILERATEIMDQVKLDSGGVCSPSES